MSLVGLFSGTAARDARTAGTRVAGTRVVGTRVGAPGGWWYRVGIGRWVPGGYRAGTPPRDTQPGIPSLAMPSLAIPSRPSPSPVLA